MFPPLFTHIDLTGIISNGPGGIVVDDSIETDYFVFCGKLTIMMKRG